MTKRPPMSQETKAKLSAAAKLRARQPHSEETKARISATMKGRKRGPDGRGPAISAGVKAYWRARKARELESSSGSGE